MDVAVSCLTNNGRIAELGQHREDLSRFSGSPDFLRQSKIRGGGVFATWTNAGESVIPGHARDTTDCSFHPWGKDASISLPLGHLMQWFSAEKQHACRRAARPQLHVVVDLLDLVRWSLSAGASITAQNVCLILLVTHYSTKLSEKQSIFPWFLNISHNNKSPRRRYRAHLLPSSDDLVKNSQFVTINFCTQSSACLAIFCSGLAMSLIILDFPPNREMMPRPSG